ncbi:MAG: hypothetical protein AAGI07_00525 [Bacteroidota bacterium]
MTIAPIDCAAARTRYNTTFSAEKYDAFLKDIHPVYDLSLDFRIAETPVFVSKSFQQEMLHLFEEIKTFLNHKELSGKLQGAVPKLFNVANESNRPSFISIDFAVCKDENGSLFPQLIELQGLASLYCYQRNLNFAYLKHFDVPKNFSPYFRHLNDSQYLALLKKIIFADEAPEHTIMLDIAPPKQKTRIDFIYSKKDLQVEPVCVTEIFQEDNQLFYYRDGIKLQVKRIYNRLIFDELSKRKDIQAKLKFDFNANLDVTWIAHPNWFYKISKYTMPFMNSKYVPETHFLNEYENWPDDLENYVLKPLFSFAGTGIYFDVSKEILDSIEDRENFILQKKVIYAPFVPTLDIHAKAEIRMLCLWDEELIPAMCLARLSKGKIMGVDYNKNKTWVGSSAVFFEQ